jgi:hypothetical protein
MDESGNTGSNYLDFDQPIFVFAGIGVKNEKIKTVEQEALKIKAKYRLKTELHAKSLFKRNKESIIEDFINMLIQQSTLFFLSVTEKKFAIATFVDSEFFDPVYNDKTDNTWTHPSPEMNKRSNFFYDNLSDEALIACGKAFRTGENMKDTYELIRRDIKGKDYAIDLYEILAGAEPHLDEIAAITSDFNKSNTGLGIPTVAVNTPNFIAFSGLIQKIDDFLIQINANDASLVFDSSREYNVTFNFMVERLKAAGRHVTVFPTGGKQTLGFDCISQFTCKDSKDSILIQLSDLYATSVRNVFQKIYYDDGSEKYSKFESFILYFVISTWDGFQSLFGDRLISDSFYKKAAKTFYDEKKHYLFDD